VHILIIPKQGKNPVFSLADLSKRATISVFNGPGVIAASEIAGAEGLESALPELIVNCRA